MSVYVPIDGNKVLNVLMAQRNGEIIAAYEKLHLYGVFAMQESQRLNPGYVIPPPVGR